MSTPQQRGYTTSISPPMGRRARVLFSNDSALRAPRLGQQLVIPVQHPDHTSVGLRAPNPYRSACPPAHSAVCHLASTISSLVVAAGHSHFRFGSEGATLGVMTDPKLLARLRSFR